MTAEQLFECAEDQLRRRQVEAARQLFEAAEQAGYDPDPCAGGRWSCYMLSGHFELAWRESDAIMARGKPDPHRFWDGRPVDGKRVLLRCLHGLGDTIQFIRYAPLIRQRAHSLVIEAQPRMQQLLVESRLADAVITWGEPEPVWDQQIEILELPRVFRTTVDSVPSDVPYLHVPSAPALFPHDGSGRLRVGVVWSASDYDPARTVPLEQFAQLFSTPGIEFFSLQAGAARAELDRCSLGILHLCEEPPTVVATAQAINQIDLLITVDTMLAHLAGALARPVWTLLPHEGDWRWMLDREDSPWYPTMRLFRQASPGDWPAVLRCVQETLQIAAATHFSFGPAAFPRIVPAPGV